MIEIRKTQIYEGMKFNRLTIITEVEPQFTIGGNKKRMVKVRCDCSTVKIIQLAELTSGGTISCGCYNLEKAKLNFKKHGHSGTRIHNIWKDMKKRCYNNKSTNYKYYGKKGIKVCNEWINSFESFYEWSIDNNYEDSLSIDRINVNGNYEPLNCRWVTVKVQSRNTTKQRPFKAISPEGNIYNHNCITAFAEEHDLKYSGISSCLNNKVKTYKGWKFIRIECYLIK